MAFDNRTRLYAECSCGHIPLIIKNWNGGAPIHFVACHCGKQIPIGAFRMAFIGARHADKFYAWRAKQVAKKQTMKSEAV